MTEASAATELRDLADEFDRLAEQGVQLNNQGAAQLARERADTIEGR